MVGGDFGQRNEDEEPLFQPGMREDQIAAREDEVVIEEKIEIKGPVLIAMDVRISEAPEPAFYGLQQMQEAKRRQARADQGYRINKPVIAGHADRLGGVEGRKSQRQNIGMIPQLLPSQIEKRRRVPEVGSQADGGLVERTGGIALLSAATYPGSHVRMSRSL